MLENRFLRHLRIFSSHQSFLIDLNHKREKKIRNSALSFSTSRVRSRSIRECSYANFLWKKEASKKIAKIRSKYAALAFSLALALSISISISLSPPRIIRPFIELRPPLLSLAFDSRLDFSTRVEKLFYTIYLITSLSIFVTRNSFFHNGGSVS